MKILRITDLGFENGGIENGIVLTQPIFEQRKHVVKIFSSDIASQLPRFSHYSFKKFSPFTQVSYSFNLNAFNLLSSVLKQFKPDVVHIHTMGQSSTLVLLALKQYPTILTIHGPEPYSKNLLLWCFPESNFKNGKRDVPSLTAAGKLRYFYHKSIYDPFFSLGKRNIDLIVTLSRYMHELMQQEGLENEYVPNGTILLKYQPLKMGQLSKTIGYVGRLEEFKGVEYLIRAVPTLRKNFSNVQLLIAGEGSQKKKLQKIAAELNLSKHVHFLGHLDRPQVEDLYSKSSVIVMPSVYPEAFGKVGIEAMSVGRPVIATDVGGISEWLIPKKTGLIVSPKNSSALSAAVTELFSDPNKLIQMGKNGRKKAEQFSLLNHVERMEKIYSKAIRIHSKRTN